MLEQNVFNIILKSFDDNKVLKKLSIGFANICSSVQDHRNFFKIVNRFWKNKREQRNKQKGSLKTSEENCS